MTRLTNEPLLRTRTYDYERLNLKGNPFPISGLTADHTPYPLIDERTDDEVHSFIEATLSGQEYGGLAILGDFGSGKTYALRYVETLLRTIVDTPDAEEILAVYVERPPRTLLGLVSDVCNRIGRVRIRNLLLELIFADLSNELANERDKGSVRLRELRSRLSESSASHLFSEDNPLEQFNSPKAVWNPAAALEMFRNSGKNVSALSDFASSSLKHIFDRRDSRSSDVATHLADFALSDDKQTIKLWNSFLAGSVCKGNQVIGEITGQAIWMHIILLLRRAGYKMVYWLVDEFEELDYHSQTKLNELRGFLAEFRDLIDANLVGFGLVLAGKVSVWDVCRQLSPAFSQRFSRIVVLQPNSFADLRRMIEERLKPARPEGYEGDTIAPFTAGALKSLERVSAGNTRVAVEACHVLLWHAASTNITEIDEAVVQNLSNINRAYFNTREGIGPNAGS